MSDDTQELQEYHYWVGHIEHTGLLTEEMAERLGAKPLGEELEPANPRRQSERGNVVSSHDIRGEERGERSRAARNKKA